MDNSSNFLSTPDGYATPDQIKSAREYAKALLSGSGQQPVQHWSQGVSNMVSALVGGSLDYNAAQREKAGRSEGARDRASNIPAANFPGAPVGAAPFTENSPTPIRQVTGDAGGGANPNKEAFVSSLMPQAIEASKKTGIDPRVIVSQAALESGWGKSAPGNNLFGIKSHGAPGGKVMPTTEIVNGQPVRTTDSFRQYNSPADSVDGYVDFINKNPRYGAVKSAQGLDAQIDALGKSGYATDRQYGAKIASIARGLPAPGGQPMAFSGVPDVSGVPAVQAVSSALRGGPAPTDAPTQVAGPTQVASSKAPAVQPVMPTAQRALPDPAASPAGPSINPALIKPQPGYTPDQLQRVMANPWIPDSAKEEAYQTMLKRGQPFMMPHPSGTGQVLVDPNNPRTQQIFRDAPHWGTSKIGDIEAPVAQSLNPSTGGVDSFNNGRPPVPGTQPAPIAPNPYGPRSDAAPPGATPPGAPVGPAGAPVAAGPVVVPPVAENAPAAPGAFPDVPVQVASTDPTAGISATVGKPRVAPVAAVAENGQPAASTLPKSGPETLNTDAPFSRVMTNLPPGVSPEMWNASRGKQELKNADETNQLKDKSAIDIAQHAITNKQDVDKSLSEDSGKAAIKKYQSLSERGDSAIKLGQELRLARNLMDDPNFNSGQFSSFKDVVNRTRALFGDKYANAANETFDKLQSGTVVDLLKSAYQGLGQIRVAEIDLLNKSNMNRNNTDASNRAVIELSLRSLDKLDKINGMAQQYVSGGDVVNPITGDVMLKAKVGPDGEVIERHGLDAGFDKLARQFNKDHPTISPEESKNFEKTFFDKQPDVKKTSGPPAAPISGPNGPGAQPAAPAAPSTGAVPPAAIEYLKANPGTRQQFEKRFGPADQYLGK